MGRLTLIRAGASISLLALLPWLTGCASMNQQVESSVTRFHALNDSGANQGKRFCFLPDPAQEGRLEYRAYSQRIARQLIEHGYRQVTDPQQAQIGVVLRYGAGESRTEQRTLPIYAQTAGGPSSFQLQSTNATTKETVTTTGTTYSPPIYNVVGTVPVNRTLHSHFLHLDMVDLTQSSKEKPVFLFEGKVTAQSERPPLAEVAPCMIQSLFREFPGPNGSVQTYQEDLTHCTP